MLRNAICLLVCFFQRRIIKFISKIVDRLSESNKSQWIGWIEKFRNDWRWRQTHTCISFHINHVVAHCIDGILQATLSKWMIPIESSTLKFLQHLLENDDLILGKWLTNGPKRKKTKKKNE